MTKRLQTIGNSAGIIIDKPILELLGITPQTPLVLSTDGERLIITPQRARERDDGKRKARAGRKAARRSRV